MYNIVECDKEEFILLRPKEIRDKYGLGLIIFNTYLSH